MPAYSCYSAGASRNPESRTAPATLEVRGFHYASISSDGTLENMVVLGLDAAWTRHHESGIGILAGECSAWRCVAVVPSINALHEQAGCSGLLSAVEALAGAPITLASVDMPLALTPITGRRSCDNELSRAFGACGCAVHSPSAERPGPVSTALMLDFTTAGFTLAFHGASSKERQVIEVYPHIAVMRLLKERYRVPYKIGRARRYWPEATAKERRQLIRANLGRILDALKDRITGITLRLPRVDAGPTALKEFEDALDGLVCAWVGASYLEGQCVSYGDETAAIWVPLPTSGCR
jgi:predicted RNase H-like nuclease